MSDEFEISENPDNVPGAVSTGYQRQNTNSEISRNGLDLSSITLGPSSNEITIDVSGGVDVNGVLYSCKTSTTITIPPGLWYIKLTAGSTVNTLTPVLSGSGTWDSTKNGRYDSGERVLNWRIETDLSGNIIIARIAEPSFNGSQVGDILIYDYNIFGDSGSGIDINGVALRNNSIKTDGTFLRTKVLNMGTWDMQTTASISVAHGVDFSKIRSVSPIVVDDNGVFYYPIDFYLPAAGSPAGAYRLNSTDVDLDRTSSSFFDSTSFNDNTINRGTVTITYEV